MGDSVMVKEYDQDQRAAICYQKWNDKKARASYIVQAGLDEVIYTDTHIMLPEAIAAKISTFSLSNHDYRNVKLTLKDGTNLAGQARGHDFMTTDEAEDVIGDDVVDVALND